MGMIGSTEVLRRTRDRRWRHRLSMRSGLGERAGAGIELGNLLRTELPPGHVPGDRRFERIGHRGPRREHVLSAPIGNASRCQFAPRIPHSDGRSRGRFLVIKKDGYNNPVRRLHLASQRQLMGSDHGEAVKSHPDEQ